MANKKAVYVNINIIKSIAIVLGIQVIYFLVFLVVFIFHRNISPEKLFFIQG